MMLQVAAVDPIRELSLAIYAILIAVELRFGINFVRAYKKDRELSVIGSIGMFFLLMAVGRCAFIVFDYYLTEMTPAAYGPNVYMYQIATALQGAGEGFFLFVAEKQIFAGRDKYLILIGYVITMALGLVYPDFLTAQSITTIGGLFILFIPPAYIYMLIKSSGPIRKLTAIVLLGMVVFAVGVIMLGEAVMIPLASLVGTRYAVHALSAVFKLVGATIVYLGFRPQIPRGG